MELRDARYKRRLSQWNLAKIANVHQSRISLIENAFVRPKNSEKKQLSKGLGVRPEQIRWPEE